METNLYHLTPEQREERDRRPAGDARRGDRRARHFGLAKQALGRHIFDRYIELKRKEWDEYRVQLTSWGSSAISLCWRLTASCMQLVVGRQFVPPAAGWADTLTIVDVFRLRF